DRNSRLQGLCRAFQPRALRGRRPHESSPIRMSIAFIDLAAQQQRIRPQIDAAIARVLAHGAYVMGPEVRALEDKLAAFAGTAHAVSCANGTEALALPLMAWEIGPGDAVFCP